VRKNVLKGGREAVNLLFLFSAESVGEIKVKAWV
jgi:hypothetical protein